MSYIGNSPALKYASFAVQHFTTSATTSYSLDNSVANENDIALFVNNVRQQPGASYAYPAAGTTLTLSAATTGSDTMYCVFIGKAVQTVVPPTGSVGTSELAALAVTNAKVADDAIGVDELSATGTASSSTFLRGDNSWTDPGGVALATSTDNQVVTVTGADAITGETYFTWNGSTCSIQADSSGATTLVVGASDNSSTNTIAFPNLANAVQGSINYLTPSDQMTFCTSSNTERLRILAAGGITFNGATAAADALDDYETGTWTPTCATGGASPSYSSQDGRYTKVGNMVYLEMHLNFTSSSTNTMTVGGLPFTVKNSEPTPLCMLFKENGSATFNTFILSQGNTLAYPRVLNGSANMTVDQWTGIAMRAVMMYTQD